MKHLGHGRVAALAVLLCACGPSPDRSYSTDNFDVHTEFVAPLCTGDLERWTQFVDHTETLLDIELKAGLDVHVWDETQWSADPWCPATTTGCYAPVRHRIFTTLASLQHELVHAVAEGWGSRNAFFSEGVAMAFEGEATSFGWSAPSDNIDLGTRRVDRLTAGHFTRWLWETRDHELLLELLASKADAAAFEKIYGQSLADAEQQYFVEVPWSYPPLFFHEVPPLTALAGDYWQESVDFDCERPDVYGRLEGIAVIRLLDIDEPGTYVLWTDSDGISISRRQHEIIVDMADAEALAGGDVPNGFSAWYAGGTLHVLELNEGEYELWVTDIGAELSTAAVAVWAHLEPSPSSPNGAG